MSDIDCNCVDEIVCPHCGYEHTDSSEFSRHTNSGMDKCEWCGKELEWFADYSVSYSTFKMEEE